MVNTRQSTPEFSGPAFHEACSGHSMLCYPASLLKSLMNFVRMVRGVAVINTRPSTLGCADEFKARLDSYKFEGDDLNWWNAFKQAKGGEAYVATLSWNDFRKAFFLQCFPRSEQQKLAGFVGKKAGPSKEQAKHFKWSLRGNGNDKRPDVEGKVYSLARDQAANSL
nr:hypothetical protein [Tanacetum cinerariifolium]